MRGARDGRANRPVPGPQPDADKVDIRTPGDVVSNIEGLVWPGVPERYGGMLLSLAYQLEQSQWWSAEEIRRHQFRQLEMLLRHAAKSVPFFRQRFALLGFDPNETLTETNWQRLPSLGRRDLQDHFQALVSEAVPRSHGRTFELTSSGSTGTPVRVVKTGLSQLAWEAVTLRETIWANRDLSGTFADIRFLPNKSAAPYPDGAQKPSWGGFTRGVSTGPAMTLNLRTPVQQQAEWLVRSAPDYLLTFPSNLEALVQHCQAHGIELPSVRQLVTISELLKPELRTLCRDVWSVEIRDMYSTQEVGYVALQCPEHEHYHVQAENVLVEILDETGRPCQPGEIGRVLVTSLSNFATALIRYDVGDYARVGHPCPCGRGLPVLESILGRVRNMLTLPSGERTWPSLGFAHFREVAPIRQSQIVQKARTSLELRFVAERDLTEAEAASVRQMILENVGCEMAIEMVKTDRLERSGGWKFEEFRSEIAE